LADETVGAEKKIVLYGQNPFLFQDQPVYENLYLCIGM